MSAYHRPAKLEDALALKAKGDLLVLAGGTDVYPMKTTRAAWGEGETRDILDISAIEGLGGIEKAGDHWRVGALVTWSDLVRADLPVVFDGLKLAAREVGGLQIQNRGTIAGNLCNASPAADGTPCLLALDASVELQSSAGSRLVPMRDFHDGYRSSVCGADELVTAILVPDLPEGARAHFVKLGARRYLVISIVMAAAVLVPGEDGRICDARVAVGACSVTAQRLAALEAELTGRRFTDDLAGLVQAAHFSALSPIDDIRASGEYRRGAALEVVRDLLRAIGERKSERAA